MQTPSSVLKNSTGDRDAVQWQYNGSADYPGGWRGLCAALGAARQAPDGKKLWPGAAVVLGDVNITEGRNGRSSHGPRITPLRAQATGASTPIAKEKRIVLNRILPSVDLDLPAPLARCHRDLAQGRCGAILPVTLVQFSS
jgi:hypothetical protein